MKRSKQKSNNMKTFKNILYFSFILLITACSKDNDNTTPEDDDITNNAPDIYIAGTFVQTELNQTWAEAAYWKNGEITLPTTSATQDESSTAYSIFVEGNNIYVAGSEVNNFKEIAKYWKNGTDVSLSLGDDHSKARSIFVDGNDVYVCGQEKHPDYGTVPKYWKNGHATILDTDAFIAFDITKSDGNVHIAGYGDDVLNKKGRFALHWKNGQVSTVSTENETAQARAIAVSGNDVYLGGFATSSEVEGTIAKIWKNGKSIPLSNNNGAIEDIAISGNDVYGVGYDCIAGTSLCTPKYWKNGQGFNLSSGSSYSIATGIAIWKDDVYIVGWEGLNTSKGIVWKNGVEMPEYTIDNASFNSIVIQ